MISASRGSFLYGFRPGFDDFVFRELQGEAGFMHALGRKIEFFVEKIENDQRIAGIALFGFHTILKCFSLCKFPGDVR